MPMSQDEFVKKMERIAGTAILNISSHNKKVMMAKKILYGVGERMKVAKETIDEAWFEISCRFSLEREVVMSEAFSMISSAEMRLIYSPKEKGFQALTVGGSSELVMDRILSLKRLLSGSSGNQSGMDQLQQMMQDPHAQLEFMCQNFARLVEIGKMKLGEAVKAIVNGGVSLGMAEEEYMAYADKFHEVWEARLLEKQLGIEEPADSISSFDLGDDESGDDIESEDIVEDEVEEVQIPKARPVTGKPVFEKKQRLSDDEKEQIWNLYNSGKKPQEIVDILDVDKSQLTSYLQYRKKIEK